MNIVSLKNYDSICSKKDIIVSFDSNNNPMSLYSDNVWDFSSSIIRKVDYGYNIHFDRIFSNNQRLLNNEIMTQTLKDIIYKLSISGIKFKTLKNYFIDLFMFLDYTHSVLNIDNINNLKESEINGYIDYLISKKMAYNTIRGKLFVIKNSFFKYRNDLNYSISFEPFKTINTTKKIKNNTNVKKHHQTDIISDLKWKEIINICQNYMKIYNNNIENENYITSRYKHHLNVKHNNFGAYYNTFKLSNSPYKNRTEHSKFIKNVQISCAMIIQAFTGMRVSELLSIKSECITRDNIETDGSSIEILKIKGHSYKYVEKDHFGRECGKEVFWICPPIVEEAVNTLSHINKGTSFYLEKRGHEYSNLPIFMSFQTFSSSVVFDVEKYYNRFLDENNINIDFNFNTHAFRRTFARFLARSIIDIPIEVIKEQFKHYSKHITFYYMKEDEKSDIEFAELINEYIDTKDTSQSKYLFDEIKNKLDSSILTVNNVDELITYVNCNKLNLITEFMASINEKPEILSPIGCLTCHGNVIIPKIHLSYWEDLLVLYDEMIELEPNSIWHNQEREMIRNVVNELKQNKAYITGINK